MNANQLGRIREMEQRLDRVDKAVKELSAALDGYCEAQADVEHLNKYYGSCEWRGDFDDDNAGKLPKCLKRGVLSEDAIWNTLSDVRELNNRLNFIAKELIKQ